MKIGVAGLGFMGATHVAAINSMAGVEVGAVAARKQKALSGDLSDAGGNLDRGPVVVDFSRVQKFTEWRAMIVEADVDAVDICLPTEFHAEAAQLALAHGKHVLVEKPMALNDAECAEMLAAAGRAGKTLMVAHVLRFWPEYLELRRFFENDQLGPVAQAVFDRSCGVPDWSPWLPDEKRSGGAVFDLLIHDVDQAIALFGVPEEVECRSLGPIDTLDATLHYAGLDVSVRGGWYPSGTPFSMGFQMDRRRGTMRLKDGLLEIRQRRIEEPRGGRDDEATGGWEPAQMASGDGYVNEIAYFVDCCRSGRAPDLCSPADSARAVRLALLLKEARLEEGRRLPCIV